MSVYNRRPSTVNLNQLVTTIPVRRKAADQVERDKFEWNQVTLFLVGLPFGIDSTESFSSGKVQRKRSTVSNVRPKKNTFEVKARNDAWRFDRRDRCLDLILGSFRLEGARLFWSMMTRLQLESHPIVCWKFCYVMHRILRDGHKNVKKTARLRRIASDRFRSSSIRSNRSKVL